MLERRVERGAAGAEERAITRLSKHLARDRIGVDEFERRLTLVHRATSIAEVAPYRTWWSTMRTPASPRSPGADHSTT
jgi:hypothetical protein